MKSVLITGASSGIGRATALRLARGGVKVFATVRSEEDAEGLRASGISTLLIDVTDSDSVARAASEVDAHGALDGLVNNAGEGIAGPLELLTDDELRAQLDVNVVGQVSVTRAMLPALRRSDDPRIVMVGSVGGRVSFPFAGAYHASKHAIEAVSEVLRAELGPEGIRTVLIEPGPYSTPIWRKASDRIDELEGRDHAARYRDRLNSVRDKLQSADERGDEPDAVAKKIEGALFDSRPGARIQVGVPAVVTARLRPLLPDGLFDAVVKRAFGS